MADTAVPTIGEIITNLGGTPTAQTIVPALEELRDAIGSGACGPVRGRGGARRTS